MNWGLLLFLFVWGTALFLWGYSVGVGREQEDWFKWLDEHEERLKTEQIRLRREIARLESED